MLTKNRRKLDSLAFTREFNIRVCRIWEGTKMISDVYLKDQKHLQEHQKQIVLQASQAEVNTTTSAITGLPASASSLCREPLWLRQPASSDAPAGAHRMHLCRPCNKAVAGQDAKKLGHSCWLYLVAHRKDPSVYEHTKKEAGKYKADLSQAEAVQLLAAKLSKNVKHPRNASKRAQGMGMSRPESACH